MSRAILWAGVAAFAVGAVLVGWLARGRTGRARVVAVAVTALPVSIGTWYLAMASGWGVTAGGHTVYWARFVDGPISVSLVVVALGLLAGVDRTTLATGVGVGAYTMAVTLGATLVTGPPKLVWTAVAVGGFCALLWILWGPFTRAAREADWPGTAAFAPARTYATLLFVLYPVPWALGPGGFALAPGEYLLVVRLALDLALKVGFGVVVVRALSR